MATTITREQLKAAKAALVAAGWMHTHSVMHDGGATGNFGSCFIRIMENGERQRFFLNVNTFEKLPVDNTR